MKLTKAEFGERERELHLHWAFRVKTINGQLLNLRRSSNMDSGALPLSRIYSSFFARLSPMHYSFSFILLSFQIVQINNSFIYYTFSRKKNTGFETITVRIIASTGKINS